MCTDIVMSGLFNEKGNRPYLFMENYRNFYSFLQLLALDIRGSGERWEEMELELEQIYKEYMHDLYRYLYSLTHHHALAEDLLQDTFAKAHVMLLGGNIRDIKPWLFKVAYYTYIDSVRKESRFIHSDTIENIDFHSPEQIILEKDAFQRLLDLLETIKPMEKQAILLCDLHDCTYEQAAEILQLKLNTFKSHLARGRRKLREKLTKEEN